MKPCSGEFTSLKAHSCLLGAGGTWPLWAGFSLLFIPIYLPSQGQQFSGPGLILLVISGFEKGPLTMSKRNMKFLKTARSLGLWEGNFSKCCWSDSSLAVVLCRKKDGLSGPFYSQGFCSSGFSLGWSEGISLVVQWLRIHLSTKD